MYRRRRRQEDERQREAVRQKKPAPESTEETVSSRPQRRARVSKSRRSRFMWLEICKCSRTLYREHSTPSRSNRARTLATICDSSIAPHGPKTLGKRGEMMHAEMICKRPRLKLIVSSRRKSPRRPSDSLW